MKSIIKVSLLASLLTTAGLVCAQPFWGDGPDQMQGMRGGGQANSTWRDQHHAMLKAQLKLTPAQEPAWAAFTDAMKPANPAASRPDPVEMAKLTTPERIAKMQAWHTEHMAQMTAAMNKRAEAVKTFYAVLTPEQQKIFDAHSLQGGRKPHRGGPGMGW